ncbi:MAG: N-acetylmuramoyl-L-alanine amidase family protein [Limisphaerales bacterium]
MLARPHAFTVAICLVLAGCATRPRTNLDNVADWQDLDTTPGAGTNQVQGSPLFTAPAPAAPTTVKPLPKAVPYEKWVPIQRWCRVNGLAEPKRLSMVFPLSYAITSSNGVCVVRAGSQLARWDGLELRLGFAPQQIDGQLYVHGLDLMKTISPLLEGDAPPSLDFNPILVIDPGHGGEDAGTRSVLGGHYEKEYTLDWALRLRALMQSRGWQVYLTRSNDTDLTLSNRDLYASAHKAALFVSLHFNSAGGDNTESGLETYCLTPVGMPSSLTRGYADPITESFPNNEFDMQNLRLALSVHRALLGVNGHADRGVRRARFPGVLRNQGRPAILIEGGYLSNPSEARLISSPAYRQKLAEAVARGIDAFSPRSTVRSPQSTVHSPEPAGSGQEEQEAESSR